MLNLRNLRQTIVIDNSWVIPHSPYLCKQHNVHTDVEVCSGITAIVYNKGVGTFILYLRNELNEIESYVAARYIGTNEAHYNLS